MGTELTVTTEKSAEINVISLLAGGNSVAVSPGMTDYSDWSTSGATKDGTGAMTHTHSIGAVTDNPNFMVIGFRRNEGEWPAVTSVQVDGVAATKSSETKNGFFTQNNIGLALWYITRTNGQWSGDVDITWTQSASSNNGDYIGVISGYVNVTPGVVDSGSRTWLTGNETFNYDAGTATGTAFFLTNPTGNISGGIYPFVQMHASSTNGWLTVVEAVFTGAESITINGSAGAQANWIVLADTGGAIEVTSEVTLTLPDEGFVEQDSIEVTVS